MAPISSVEKMRRRIARAESILLMMLAVVVICSGFARSQTATSQTGDSRTDQSASESLKKLDRLVEQNSQLEKQNRELMDQIESLRRVLAKQVGAEPETSEQQTEPATGSKTAWDSQQSEDSKATAKLTSSEEEPYKWGAYTPNLGYKVANTDSGDLSISI